MGLLRTSREYRALFISRTVSAVGDTLSLVTLMLFVAGRTGQALAVALLLLAGDFAPSLVAPLVGAVADRFELRRVMITCDLVSAVLVGVMVVWLPGPGGLLALVGLRALTAQVFGAASRAALPLLIADAQLERGNATLGLGSNVGEVAGPLLAAGLLPLLGVRGTLAIDALSFLVSAASLGFLPALPRTRVEATSILTAAHAGLASVWSRPVVRVIVLGFTAVVACTGMDDLALVFLARQDLGASASATAILLGGVGIGLLAGFAVLARLSPRVGTAVAFVVGLAVSSAGNAATGVAPAVAAAVGLQIVRGLGVAAMDVGSVTLLQRLVPDELRGRVFGNLYGLVGVAAALSYVLGAVLVDRLGPRLTLVVAGLAGLVAAGLVGWRLTVHLRSGAEPAAPLD